MKKIRTIFVSFIAILLTVVLTSSVVYAASSLENPLNPQFSSIPNFIAGFLRVLVMIALPIITVFFVIAGYKFVSAGGNEGKITDAKNNFYGVVFGAILILGAWVLATLIGGTVSQLTG